MKRRFQLRMTLAKAFAFVALVFAACVIAPQESFAGRYPDHWLVVVDANHVLGADEQGYALSFRNPPSELNEGNMVAASWQEDGTVYVGNHLEGLDGYGEELYLFSKPGFDLTVKIDGEQAEVTPYANGWVMVYVPGGRDRVTVELSGTYGSNAASYVPSVKAAVTGRDAGLQAGELSYTATVTAADGSTDDFGFLTDDLSAAGATLGSDGSTVTLANPAAGSDGWATVAFPKVYFAEAGIYKVSIAQTAGSDSRITYDSHVYQLVVAVVNNNGKLEIASVETNGADSFTNMYASGETKPNPGPNDKTNSGSSASDDAKPSGDDSKTPCGSSKSGDGLPQTGDRSPVAMALVAGAGVLVLSSGMGLLARRR